MATPLDTGLLQSLSAIFPFLLTFVVVFAVLGFTNVFKGNKGIHGFIAVILAFMVLLSDIATDIISTMAPWFIVLFFAIIFIIMTYKIFGFSDEHIMGVLKSKNYGYLSTWIMAIAIIIILGTLTSELSERGARVAGGEGPNATGLSEATESEPSEFWDTLFHPKVLGLALIFLIGGFTVSRLTQET